MARLERQTSRRPPSSMTRVGLESVCLFVLALSAASLRLYPPARVYFYVTYDELSGQSEQVAHLGT